MVEWIWKDYSALTKDELYEILRCRQEVFAVEQNVVYQDCDNLDVHSWHLFTLLDDKTIGAYLRVVKPGHKYKEASIGRVLTMPSMRGSGIGRQLTQEAISQLTKEGVHEIRISAQQYLEDFYSSFGFKTVSAPYIEDDIPHIGMLLSA